MVRRWKFVVVPVWYRYCSTGTCSTGITIIVRWNTRQLALQILDHIHGVVSKHSGVHLMILPPHIHKIPILSFSPSLCCRNNAVSASGDTKWSGDVNVVDAMSGGAPLMPGSHRKHSEWSCGTSTHLDRHFLVENRHF